MKPKKQDDSSESSYYFTLFESASDAILVGIPDGRIINANSAACMLFQYTREEIIGMNVAALFPPESVEWLKKMQKEDFANDGKSFIGVRKDGRSIPVEVMVKIFAQGEEKYLLVTARDFTERAKDLEEIRRQGMINKFLNETIVGLFNRLDLDDLLKAIVTQACELFETSDAFVCWVDESRGLLETRVGTGRYEQLFLTGYTFPLGVGAVGKVGQTGRSFLIEDYQKWPDRNPDSIWDNLQATMNIPLKSGEKVIGVIGVDYFDLPRHFSTRDIELFDRFAELASIAAVNASLHSELAMSERELEGKVAERTQEIFAANQELTAVNEESVAMNAELVATNEKLQNANGELQREIAERKRAEEKLTEACGELNNAQMRIIQQEKMAGIGQLAAGVAHEINNPLGFVSSNFETLQKYTNRLLEIMKAYRELSELVLQENVPLLQDKAEQISTLLKQKKLSYIMDDLQAVFSETTDGISRISNIVRALRVFSRVDQQNFEEYDVNEGIRVSLTIARNEIKYVAEVQENLNEVPMIMALSGQVNQVLLNIIINAGHAIKAKGADSLGLITINTWADEEFVYCSIKDTGTGIPEKIRKAIFDPFFTTKPAGQGTGLGLSISYDIIINKHHGDILVESEEGMGTTFIIKLPINNQANG